MGRRVMDAEVGREKVGDAPRTFADLQKALLEPKRKLPRRLAQIAAFATANPDDIAFGTAASIATSAQVQPSALVRFAHALGFGGFSDMQAVFRERLRDRIPSYEDRLVALSNRSDPVTKTGALLDGFTAAAEQSIVMLRERLRPEALDEAISLLAAADTIYLIGQRRSYPVTSYLNYALGKLGVRNVLVGSAQGNDPETLSFARPTDAAIAVSFTPYASATIDYARSVADCGTPLVAITDSPFSPLLPPASLWFEVAEQSFEGFRPMAATLALSMTLAVGIAERRGTK